MQIAGAAVPAEIVDSAGQADQPADRLWRVFDACCDGLYRFILVRVGGDRHAADDLLQQTCCVAARQRAGPMDDAACEAWLRGVARNLIRRHWRERKKHNGHLCIEDAALSRRLVEDMEARPLPPDALMRDEAVARLMLAVTALPAADQALVFAFYFEGRPHAEMAAAAGTTVKSVETKLYRARSRLRTMMKDPERMDGP